MPIRVETKPWYTSKTIIGVIIAVVGSLLAFIFKNPAIQAGIEVEAPSITAIILQGVAIIGGAVALIGRLVASSKLTK